MIFDFAYTFMALVGTLLLFGAVVYALKYVQKKYQVSSNIKVKENLFLDTKRRVCVIEYKGQEYMLLLGTQGEHMIDLRSGENREKQFQKAA